MSTGETENVQLLGWKRAEIYIFFCRFSEMSLSFSILFFPEQRLWVSCSITYIGITLKKGSLQPQKLFQSVYRHMSIVLKQTWKIRTYLLNWIIVSMILTVRWVRTCWYILPQSHPIPFSYCLTSAVYRNLHIGNKCATKVLVCRRFLNFKCIGKANHCLCLLHYTACYNHEQKCIISESVQ